MAGYFEATVSKAKIYIGPRAGGPVKNSLESATKSIDIITPYISLDCLDFLLKKAKEGVNVNLATSTECASNPGEWRKMMKRLIQQNRERIPGASTRVMRFKGYSLFLAIIGAAAAYAQWSRQLPQNTAIGYTVAGLCLAVVSALLIEANRTRLYTYTYLPRINFAAYIPWKPGCANDCMLMHAKVYVVDEVVLATGSLNFSTSGLVFNCEVRTDLYDRDTAQRVAQEVRNMVEAPWASTMSIEEIGKTIYSEPR